MIRVQCRTNLDLFNEKWPSILPRVPVIGDHVQSETRWNNFQLVLEVVRVTFKCNSDGNYYPEIELGMTNFHKGLPTRVQGAAIGSIRAFYEWYAPLVGKSVGFFI